MASSLKVLRDRERLRVGKRFLILRPRFAALAAAGNAVVLKGGDFAPAHQRVAMALALGLTVSAFFLEAQWLRRRPLTERWLLSSLGLTLLALGVGSLLSGGLVSPVLPLLFAPIVVGLAAFGQSIRSGALIGEAVVIVLVLAFGPIAGFPRIPWPEVHAMLLINTLFALILIGIGVTGLVDAHGNVSVQLERLRRDTVLEAERRSASVERLGAEVAHEVKNPLAAARGLVQLVTRRITDERDAERLNVVVGEIDRALQVLGDYLSFSRPLTKLELAPVELRGLLQDVAGVLEARAFEKSLDLSVNGDAIQVLGDRQRLKDAVLNLALNAVTALPRGGKLELRSTGNSDKALLEVIDNGPGISSELSSKLGQAFASESEGGTGLGILLAKSVTKQHGGELRFEPRPSGGVRVMLELPRALDLETG